MADAQPFHRADVFQRASHASSRRSCPTLGAMEPSIADRLIESMNADVDSRVEWERAQRFFYSALRAIKSRLPLVAQQQLETRGPNLPPAAELEAARIALWQSIEADQMGNTPEGAAVRAALFAFFPPEEDGPLDAIAFFCTFFARAALPESALVAAFHEQWPQNGA